VAVIARIIMFLLSTWPANPSYLHADELAQEFEEHGAKYNVDPVLLVVMAYQESSITRDAVGALGEVGYFQVHGKSRKACEAANLDPLGIECGAMLLDMNRRYCGSMERGLHRYMSGFCAGTPRARRKTESRLKKAEMLRKKFI
jgi:hypothetical protein